MVKGKSVGPFLVGPYRSKDLPDYEVEVETGIERENYGEIVERLNKDLNNCFKPFGLMVLNEKLPQYHEEVPFHTEANPFTLKGIKSMLKRDNMVGNIEYRDNSVYLEAWTPETWSNELVSSFDDLVERYGYQ